MLTCGKCVASWRKGRARERRQITFIGRTVFISRSWTVSGCSSSGVVAVRTMWQQRQHGTGHDEHNLRGDRLPHLSTLIAKTNTGPRCDARSNTDPSRANSPLLTRRTYIRDQRLSFAIVGRVEASTTSQQRNGCTCKWVESGPHGCDPGLNLADPQPFTLHDQHLLGAQYLSHLKSSFYLSLGM